MRVCGRRCRVLVLAVLVVTAGACGPAPEVSVRDPWIRAVPPTASATAAYFVLRNEGDRERVLTAVSATGMDRVEIHETRLEDGLMRMRRLDEIRIEAGGQAVLAPGGRHLMLFAAELPAPGDEVRLELRFADGTTLEFDAPVRRGGD